jgi:hypothetical protein
VQQRGEGSVSTLEKGGRGKSWSPCKHSVNKDWKNQKGLQQAGDKPLPEIEHVEVHKAHLLSHWATSKWNNAAKLKTNQQTIITCWQQRASWRISDLV